MERIFNYVIDNQFSNLYKLQHRRNQMINLKSYDYSRNSYSITLLLFK